LAYHSEFYTAKCYVAGDVENILHDLKPSASVQILSKDRPNCQCIKYNCGCCVHFTWEKVKLVNATGLCYVNSVPFYSVIRFLWWLKCQKLLQGSLHVIFASAFIAIHVTASPDCSK